MENRKEPPTFLTVASMARRLNVPTSRINRVIESRHIPTAAYAGDNRTRLYFWRDLVRVHDALIAIDARRADRRERREVAHA